MRHRPPRPARLPPHMVRCRSRTVLQTFKLRHPLNHWWLFSLTPGSSVLKLGKCRPRRPAGCSPTPINEIKVSKPLFWKGRHYCMLFVGLQSSKYKEFTRLVSRCFFPHIHTFLILKFLFQIDVRGLQKGKWKWLWNPAAHLSRISVELLIFDILDYF